MVTTAETVVVEEEEALVGEVEEVDVVQVVVNKGSNSSRRNHQTPCSIKTKIKPQSAKYVGSLATLQISVGTCLHRLEEIHLGVVSPSPEVETKVHTDQAVAHKEEEAEGSLQWLTTSHMAWR